MKSFARYHQIINIEFHKLSSYFSYNITELNKKHEYLPYYENSLNIIDNSSDSSNWYDDPNVELNIAFIKELSNIYDFKYKSILVGRPSIYLSVNVIEAFTDACWQYIFDKSAASLRVKIDYKIIECDTFIFSDNFKDWFLDLIFDV